MSKLMLTFTGSVLDLKITLEGHEVGLHFDGVSEWSRTLENFTIEGKLDLFMLCKGLNGTSWNFEIVMDNEELKQYSGKIEKGFSTISDKIDLQE